MQNLSPLLLEAFTLPQHVAIAVSGGSDSMALALLTQEWALAHGCTITALTVDHGLRPESANEAQQVGQWMLERGIPHHILTITVSNDGNTQANARTARYDAMSEWCRQRAVDTLLLAHHQDDQAETLLLRLARGSGVAGLRGMQPETSRDGIRLVRPLLEIPKSDLHDYLRRQNQCWVEDPSNQSSHYGRNRLRTLMPALAAIGITSQALAHSAARLGETHDFILTQTLEALKSCATMEALGYARLQISSFRTLHPLLQQEALRHMLCQISGNPLPPRAGPLQHALTMLQDSSPTGFTLHGCQLFPVSDHPQSGDWYIARESSALPSPMQLPTETGSFIWDNRFTLQFATGNLLQSPVMVHAIQHLPRTLRREALSQLPAHQQRLPRRILDSLPALTCLDRLLALPHIPLNYLPEHLSCQLRFRAGPLEGYVCHGEHGQKEVTQI